MIDYRSIGYDSKGNPCNCIDENGMKWIYVGKMYGADNWQGVPIVL